MSDKPRFYTAPARYYAIVDQVFECGSDGAWADDPWVCTCSLSNVEFICAALNAADKREKESSL